MQAVRKSVPKCQFHNWDGDGKCPRCEEIERFYPESPYRFLPELEAKEAHDVALDGVISDDSFCETHCSISGVPMRARLVFLCDPTGLDGDPVIECIKATRLEF